MQQENERRSEVEFLGELKSQFERDIDLRKTLDSKTNTMITMSSSIVTILIAIGTFLISKIEPKDGFYYYLAIGIFALGVTLATLCIILLTTSYFLRSYTYPMGHEKFFDNGTYKKEKADKYIHASKEKFTDLMIQEYLVSIKTYAEMNSKRAETIKKGQKFLIPAIISIAVLVGYVLIFHGAHLVQLTF